MGKKYTIVEIEQIIKELGYDLVKAEHKNKKRYITMKDSIGYYYTGDFYMIRKYQPHKFHTSNPYSLDNIKLYLKVNNLPYELLTELYEGNDKHLILRDSHGYRLTINLGNLLQGCTPQKVSAFNIFSIQNIKLWCRLNNKPFMILSEEYIGSDVNLQWQCLKDDCGEIFETTWDSVLQNNGCSFCVGQKVGLSNCLATRNPELVKEWHPTRNGDLTPYEVSYRNSTKYIWWQCSKNPKHEWKAKVAKRNVRGDKCPFCSHKLASEDYNLLVINPKLCEEWDYDKNVKKPEEFCPCSSKYVWWKCKEGHGWEASIAKRNLGRNCPECNESHGETQIREVFLKLNFLPINQKDYNNLSELNNNTYFIPQKTFSNLVGVGGGLLSYDFYLPKYNLLIEYQGEFHDHAIRLFKDEPIEIAKARLIRQQEHDRRKKEFAKNNNIELLEIWYWDFDRIEEILVDYIKPHKE